MTSADMIALAVNVFPLVAALAGFLYQMVVAQLPAKKQAQLGQVTSTVVGAVEQTMSHLPGTTNADKKSEAMRLARLALGRFGVNNEVLSAFIEAAVATLPPTTSPAATASEAAIPADAQQTAGL